MWHYQIIKQNGQYAIVEDDQIVGEEEPIAELLDLEFITKTHKK